MLLQQVRARVWLFLSFFLESQLSNVHSLVDVLRLHIVHLRFLQVSQLQAEKQTLQRRNNELELENANLQA